MNREKMIEYFKKGYSFVEEYKGYNIYSYKEFYMVEKNDEILQDFLETKQSAKVFITKRIKKVSK
nr:hypothetical protein [Clostridia bacterium]